MQEDTPASFASPISLDMDTEHKKIKVVIVGAGIAGLSLANILKRADVDFVILEAHGDFSRPVGGSYGIWPNAARILDQIDCWTDIQSSCSPIEANHIRLPNGGPIKSGSLSDLVAARFEMTLSLVVRLF